MRKEWIVVIGLGDGCDVPIFGRKEEHHKFQNYKAALAFLRSAQQDGKWVKIERPLRPVFTGNQD